MTVSAFFNAPSLAPGAVMCMMRDPFAREPGGGVGWEVCVAWAQGTASHLGSVYTHSRRKDFQEPSAWGCCVLVFCKRGQIVCGVRNRNTEGFGLQNKGVGWFGRVPRDKLERFTISWIGVSVLGMLRFEPFQ